MPARKLEAFAAALKRPARNLRAFEQLTPEQLRQLTLAIEAARERQRFAVRTGLLDGFPWALRWLARWIARE